jgi:hypothetical protein
MRKTMKETLTMKTKSSKPVPDGAGNKPGGSQGDSSGAMDSGAGGTTGSATGGGAGDSSRPASQSKLEAMLPEMKEWAIEYWAATYKATNPHWSPEVLRRRAEEQAERDPVTIGFFLPRVERDALLAQGLDHFQLETHVLQQVVKVHDAEGKELDWLKAPGSPS